ncbi:MAG: SDR family oxidoreductase [Candidatus Dadabacteria bacterium]|nr:MAG: SDR family oxidoreductase [Candidatus Dadabacteria bacterium]
MNSQETPVSLITGGASGIGLAIARRLVQRGERVALFDVNAEGLAAARAELGADACLAVTGSVTDAAALNDAVAQSIERFGRFDRIINNAGIEISGELRDLTLDHWRRTVDINLLGVANGVHAAYPRFIEQGHGTIVNVASGAGLVMFPTSIPYTATKAAVVGLTRALRAEAEAYGVDVVLVNPGMVRTPIFERSEAIGPAIPDLIERLPGRVISADKAARIIVRGIDRKQPEITFPIENVIGAWMVNVLPAFGRRARRQIVELFRSLTREA